MSPVITRLRGDGLVARVMRSSAWTALGYGASQALRLASNLILTRLLFPEAFGLMALVSVFIVGLTMFSDMGTHPAILQHKRGDDVAFLNTAFSIQVTRGAVLWLASAAIAYPAALFYGQPELAWLLPVAGFSLLLHGLEPTRVDTAARHLRLGRLTALDLASQVVGVVSMVGLAWATQSVWALVAGWIVSSGTRLALVTWALPGPKSRLGWEPAAARDLMHFGFWLFLSTACGFLVAQGDKAILGKYLTLEQLGLYNIGFFLASFPMLLGQTIGGRILIPLYRERPPGASVENFAKLRQMRFALSGAIFALLAVMAFGGEWIVDLLYDPRYSAAGAILVLIAVIQIPSVIGMTYDQSALAAGDSRNYFLLTALRAIFLVAGLIVGAERLGLVGALVGQAMAAVAVYPFLIWLARRHKAWDWVHDLTFAVLGLGIASLAVGLDRSAIFELLTLFGAGTP
ncbi:oligosaccharide flippase family protein [Pseudotabrizicola alkalilacus]|uniref:Polysaccharide biosynthesis protein n=1 Tax=Pseudotabrizicola alkalilacus TaxID=2305252 RepID=A0A411Z2D7_9RHOB|nr:oligosaccharide flippase family protein [Pseudotabrizicola alkalilacus]RGP37236.1 polysaccharide biosynthesis protein [Pseudotabrizicola alkalilacus]